jgi:hypothetical protein
MDRRSSQRIASRFPCEIVRDAATLPCVLMNLSEGGLAVRTESEFEQGESLRVRLKPPGRPAVQVVALVWHTRRVRLRGSGKRQSVLGLMLPEIPDDYVQIAARPRRPVVSAQRDSRAAESRAAPDPAPSLRDFCIRLKQRSGLRTRIVRLSATSEAEARSLAREEICEEWELLEIHESAAAAA